MVATCISRLQPLTWLLTSHWICYKGRIDSQNNGWRRTTFHTLLAEAFLLAFTVEKHRLWYTQRCASSMASADSTHTEAHSRSCQSLPLSVTCRKLPVLQGASYLMTGGERVGHPLDPDEDSLGYITVWSPFANPVFFPSLLQALISYITWMPDSTPLPMGWLFSSLYYSHISFPPPGLPK